MPTPIRDLIRAMNRATILDIIRNHGLISRIDIARRTGLSQASVTGLTADLLKEGLIIEKQPGEYEGGRRPILLALNPDGAFVVGVNLTLTEISTVIINFEAEIIAESTIPLDPEFHSVEEISDMIVRGVQTCIWEANFTKDQIAGIGLGIPGLVDSSTGIIKFMPNYDWENENLQALVGKKLNHPTYIDNSSNTLAIAEQWFGLGKGSDNFIVVTIENGVGMGGVVHGSLYRGQNGIAGEFGHITVDPDGPVCRCGKKGCLETYAGNLSIVQNAVRLAKDGSWSRSHNGRVTYEEVLADAQKGNPDLIHLFNRAGEMLAVGISHLIHLYNPVKIILTGKGVKAGGMMFDPMHKILPSFMSERFGNSSTQIVIREWAEKDWARGAGALVLQVLYKSPVSQVSPVVSL